MTDRAGRYVELPKDAAQRLDQPIRANPTTTREVAALAGGVGWRIADSPGLFLEALGDSSLREAFTVMRWEGERRLHDLLRWHANAALPSRGCQKGGLRSCVSGDRPYSLNPTRKD